MKKVHTIFNHTTDSGTKGILGIDDDSKLYWNGKPVVTEQRVSLGWIVNTSAVLASLATVVSAWYTVMDFYSK